MIVNQLKLMSVSPAFKIDQKICGMLVTSNFDNHYVFLLQHFLMEKEIVTCQETTDKTTVLTEYKVWLSKRKKTDKKVLFFQITSSQLIFVSFFFDRMSDEF